MRGITAMLSACIMLSLIVKELLFRKGQAFAACVGIAAAVALYVGFTTLGGGVDRETARIMRDMGFNLRIIPKAADEGEFWSRGYSESTMPEEYVSRFATQEGLSYARVMATLQQRVVIDGHELVLTGIAPEVSPPDQGKKSMSFVVDPGTLYLGYHAARLLDAKTGGTVSVLGRDYEVARVLSEAGSDDDIRVYGALVDVQAALNLPGQINEIQAMDCLCRDPEIETIDILRAELDTLMPEAKMIQLAGIHQAREKQRLMIEEYLALAMPFAMVICAAWVAALAMLNARDRRPEIGLWRALGYGPSHIAGLLLGKFALLGVFGAAIGFAAGTSVALYAGPDIFEITSKALTPDYGMLFTALIGAPIFATASALIPAMFAATQDPADVLRDD